MVAQVRLARFLLARTIIRVYRAFCEVAHLFNLFLFQEVVLLLAALAIAVAQTPSQVCIAAK